MKGVVSLGSVVDVASLGMSLGMSLGDGVQPRMWRERTIFAVAAAMKHDSVQHEQRIDLSASRWRHYSSLDRSVGSKEGIHGLPSNVHTAAHRIDGNLVEGQTAEERQHVRRDPCT